MIRMLDIRQTEGSRPSTCVTTLAANDGERELVATSERIGTLTSNFTTLLCDTWPQWLALRIHIQFSVILNLWDPL
jgi:hypothetical protein